MKEKNFNVIIRKIQIPVDDIIFSCEEDAGIYVKDLNNIKDLKSILNTLKDIIREMEV